MVKIETNTTHPATFIYQPVAAPHQSFLPIGSEVPIAKKSSFPPGEAKNSETFGEYYLQDTPSASRSLSSSLREGAKGASRQREAKSLPYRVRWKSLACSNQRGTLPQLRVRSAAPSEREPRRLRRKREATSLPYNGRCKIMSLYHSTQYTPSVIPSGCQLPQRGSQGRFAPQRRCPAVPLPQWVCSLITLCSRMPRT